ncbi:MAG: hypothetical protein MUC83_17765 [Pirellula sp.]|nr:hypothetical protein [Pirellula sp.]
MATPFQFSLLRLHDVEARMKADDRKRQPEAEAAITPTVSLPVVPPEPTGPTTVSEGVADLFRSVGTTSFLRSRGFAALLAILAVYLVYSVMASSSQRAASQLWTELERLPNADLEKFGIEHRNTVPGRIARLEDARRKLGPDGVLQFNNRDAERRAKAILSVEQARDEFAKLADEFGTDLVLRAESLKNAAEAELALVGVRKVGTTEEFYGSVPKAIDYLKKFVQLVGEQSSAGQAATKRIDDLTKNEAQIRLVGLTLDQQFGPRPKVTGPTPPSELAPPVAPSTAPAAGLIPPASPNFPAPSTSSK